MATKQKPRAKARRAKPAKAKAKGSVKQEVLEMLRVGASLDALMRKFEWQRHSVRGLISNLGKAGNKIESEKTEAGRFYRLAS
jgi:hypothetical protein